MNTFLLTALISTTALAQATWRSETAAIPSASAGDLAISVDRGNDAGAPLIVACDPSMNGLYVFGFDGVLRQQLPRGPMRGVDARSSLAFPTAGRTFVAASAYVSQQLQVFTVFDGGMLDDALRPLVNVPTPGALALYRPRDGGLEAWVDDGSRKVRHYVLEDDGAGSLTATAAGDVTFPVIPSALAVDDRTGRLYAALPSQGVFIVERGQATPDVLIPLDGGEFPGPLLGGVALYPLRDGGVLVLSTTPPSDFVAVHSVAGTTATHLTDFTVGPPDGSVVVRVRSPQHLDVLNAAVGAFDAGLLVLQDSATASYKLVDWAELARSTTPNLPVELPLAPVADAGRDAGIDAGVADAGLDGGADAGHPDSGTGGGAGGGTGGGTGGGGKTGGGTGGSGGGAEAPGCNCTGGGASLLPVALLLWWSRRFRQAGRGEGAATDSK